MFVGTVIFSPRTLTSSFAANSIRSSSEMDGVLQCVGSDLVVLMIQVALVPMKKYKPHRLWHIAGLRYQPSAACSTHVVHLICDL